jgi:GT2 family glycosyltransferase
MSIEQRANPYDETYYRVGCGVPYERNPHWLTFFARIADAIVREINPSSVLDAGCAMGFLVEALRQRGVQAYGVDISEYAIAQVAEEIKPYCWVSDLAAEPLPRRYDLVVSIETLEHLRAEQLPGALRNLCAAADDILFSSTPDDYSETTHFSVQPPEMWASRFAAQGFWHDVEFDAAFVTPWAMRFRRSGDPAPRAVIPLERALWRLRRENTALRALANGEREGASAPEPPAAAAPAAAIAEQGSLWPLLQEALDAANASAQGQAQRHELIALAAENSSLRRELARVSTQLHELLSIQRLQEARLSYKLTHGAIKSADLLLPEGSRRGNLYRRASRAIRGQPVTAPATAPIDDEALPLAVVAARAAARDSMPYDEWARATTPSRAELALGKREIARWTSHPTISLITPVYDPPLHALRDAIESVSAQTYPHWELCLADGGSQTTATELIAEYAQRDPRIRVRRLERNQGIAGNTNAAAELATGEFLLFFDHDDTIEPDTLFEVARALQADPTLDILYFDEDKLAADGARREEPFFKPDWSPELLLSVNYLTHCALRRSLYQEVGGCDPQFDGTQDWDLLLKATERSQRIHHIARPLYHWRKAPASAAGDVAAKPYVFERQRQAVVNHLERIGVTGTQAAFTDDGRLRVSWPVTHERISIIIPTKDKRALLEQCLASLVTLTHYDNYEIILVDTGSVEPETLAYYDALKRRRKLHGRLTFVDDSGPFNYSRANNLGAAAASGSLLLFLNNDTEITTPDWLEELARWVLRPEVGVVGTQLYFPGGQIQHAGVVMGMGGHAGHVFAGLEAHTPTIFGSPDWYRDYLAVTGACLMTRRAVFERVGGFDAGYQLAFSDVEYCLRARDEGFRTVYTPFASLKHHESASRGPNIPLCDIQRGFERMIALVERGDSYFNPNLASGASAPTLALNDAAVRAERLRQIVRHREFANG